MMSETVKVLQTQKWCQNMNIKYDERIVPYYVKGIELYEEKRFFVVNKDRLIKYNSEYNFFRKWFDDVLLACDDISQNEDILIYIYTLIEIILADDDVEILKAPDLNCRATDFAPLFSFMYFLDDMISEMKSRGCSYQIISDTLNGFDSEITDYHKIFGRSGMRIYVSWFMLFIKCRIFRIGKLQFEIRKLQDKIKVYEKNGDLKILIDGEHMHRKGMVFGSAMQTDEEGKYFADISHDGNTLTGYATNELGECSPQKVSLKGYKELINSEDYVISVHIPSDGPLDYEVCEKSYKEAELFFRKAYPEYGFKAFYCSSWLMEKRLKSIIGYETNITRFLDEYVSYPILSQGGAVYFTVFGLAHKVSPDKLADGTSLQKKIKAYLEAGYIIYEKGGIRMFKYI